MNILDSKWKFTDHIVDKLYGIGLRVLGVISKRAYSGGIIKSGILEPTDFPPLLVKERQNLHIDLYLVSRHFLPTALKRRWRAFKRLSG